MASIRVSLHFLDNINTNSCFVTNYRIKLKVKDSNVLLNFQTFVMSFPILQWVALRERSGSEYFRCTNKSILTLIFSLDKTYHIERILGHILQTSLGDVVFNISNGCRVTRPKWKFDSISALKQDFSSSLLLFFRLQSVKLWMVRERFKKKNIKKN